MGLHVSIDPLSTAMSGVLGVARPGLVSLCLAFICSVLLVSACPATAQSAVHMFYGVADDDHLGQRVQGAGDVNADGVPDILAGAPYTSLGPGLEDAGRVWIFSGVDGLTLGTIDGTTCCSAIGLVISRGGDLNLDNHDDLLVKDVGKTSAYSGIDFSILYEVPDPVGPASGYGASLASIGDLDGDSVPDFVVGANADDEIYGYSGRDGSLLFVYGGPGSPDSLGDELAAAGDVNGDGIPDIVSGAKFDFPGKAQVLSGADGSVIWSFDGGALATQFGSSVAGDGDVDGDGIPDILIGDSGSNYVEPGAGSVWIYSGADGSLVHAIAGSQQWQLFGSSVDYLGDVNGDGCDDFAVGIELADWSATNAGAVRVYSGRSGEVLYTFNGEPVPPNSGSRLGSSVSRLGDVNLDGVPDLIAGGPRASNLAGDANAGMVNVYALWAQVLEPPSPGIPGALNLLTMSGGTPNANVAFAWSGSVGVVPLPFCGVASTDLAVPQVIGVGQSNAAGTATASALVPGSASGKTIFLQALDLSGCVASNLVSYTFP